MRPQAMVLLAGMMLIAGSAVLLMGASSAPDGTEAGIDKDLLRGGVHIETLPSDPRGGRAYRLTYVVDVPKEVYWRFKTDFDTEFLIDNRFIDEHRVVDRMEGAVVTENRYSHTPDAVFRWKTTIQEAAGKIEFILLNPEQVGQRFHYGNIRVKGLNEKTLVVQEAFFDFFGVSLWVHYPWSGGMRHFLQYTANWEQRMVLQLRERYE